MKPKLFFILILALITWSLSLGLTSSAPAADSTSFNPTKVQVRAKTSGGVPIGTIVAWPVATNPADWDKWLECNGQTINASVYPELAALMGARVPDLRGLFLRGFGNQSHTKNNGSTVGNTATLHQSGVLGQIQGDTIRNIEGLMSNIQLVNKQIFHGVTGVFSKIDKGTSNTYTGTEGYVDIYFNASNVVPTTSGVNAENRPVNMAVRYLIRAAR